MYTQGGVSDYRWMYDMGAPTLPELLCTLRGGGASASAGSAALPSESAPEGQLLSEGEEEGGAAAWAGGASAERQRAPLLPAACALALLPSGGRSHAPTALQHLMTEGSPLEEIYRVCPECTALGRQLSIGGRRRGRAGLAVWGEWLACSCVKCSAVGREVSCIREVRQQGGVGRAAGGWQVKLGH